jgi:hypothetical protein
MGLLGFCPDTLFPTLSVLRCMSFECSVAFKITNISALKIVVWGSNRYFSVAVGKTTAQPTFSALLVIYHYRYFHNRKVLRLRPLAVSRLLFFDLILMIVVFAPLRLLFAVLCLVKHRAVSMALIKNGLVWFGFVAYQSYVSASSIVLVSSGVPT